MVTLAADMASLLLRRASEDEQRQQRVELLEHAAPEGLAESLHELKAPLHATSGSWPQLMIWHNRWLPTAPPWARSWLTSCRMPSAWRPPAPRSLLELAPLKAGRTSKSPIRAPACPNTSSN